ncbi:ABC transporter ATP-binding protein [Hymenobacter metallicola]|uniref:ABC transporter ATP-binding protein n=1 Tax=Hymenobacter metallicola TaxID=2563114 RepID=A0A4Z0QDI0_9BACT|nr:ABC transporter ATP-binding protein [Hymenobacter metallicola]TGE27419.1 ABC transporter ATP-binding protein [Hymenobacter metallicola]
MYVLEIDALTKVYGRATAVQAVSFQVPAGSVFGLLGPNGSGKTTTMGMALGVLHATSGSVRWFSEPLSEATKRRIGAMLEAPNFYPYLSAYQNLERVAAIKRVAKSSIASALAETGLLARQHDRFQTFSLGMKQRLAIAATLLGNPEVLVLDEPTNGLDPQGIVEVRTLILDLAARGKTVIISSHLLDEIEKMCTHLVVLNKGQVCATGPVESFFGTAGRTLIRPRPETTTQQLRQVLGGLPWVTDLQDEGNGYTSLNMTSGYHPGDLNMALFAQGIVVSEITPVRRNLETQFFALINR